MATVAEMLVADVEPETTTRALEGLEAEPTSPAAIDAWHIVMVDCPVCGGTHCPGTVDDPGC
jgi:hypothetical protein